MAGVLTSDDPGPAAPSPSRHPWRLLMTRLRTTPVAAPFHDSDFELEEDEGNVLPAAQDD